VLDFETADGAVYLVARADHALRLYERIKRDAVLSWAILKWLKPYRYYPTDPTRARFLLILRSLRTELAMQKAH
jgi:hypothetical protein